MQELQTIEGHLTGQGLRFGIIATRFNDFIVDRLISGAVDYLVRHGVDRADITLIRLPGAFEMPLVAKRIAASQKYDGIICLGAIGCFAIVAWTWRHPPL